MCARARVRVCASMRACARGCVCHNGKKTPDEFEWQARQVTRAIHVVQVSVSKGAPESVGLSVLAFAVEKKKKKRQNSTEKTKRCCLG